MYTASGFFGLEDEDVRTIDTRRGLRTLGGVLIVSIAGLACVEFYLAPAYSISTKSIAQPSCLALLGGFFAMLGCFRWLRRKKMADWPGIVSLWSLGLLLVIFGFGVLLS